MTWNLSKALLPHRSTRPRSTTSARRRKVRPRLELLEGRALLATFTWSSSPADTNWNNPANWEGGSVPTGASGPVDLIFPSTAADPTITLQAAQSDLQIQSLNIQGGNYKFQGPTAAGKLPVILLDNAAITLSPGARLDINPAATPDSLALKIQGNATLGGTGFLYLNTSTVTYPGNPASLLTFAVNGGNLNIGASANLGKSLVTLATGSSLVVLDGASPTVGLVSGDGRIDIGTGGSTAGTGLIVNTPAGQSGQLNGIIAGQGGTLTKAGAGSFTVSRVNPSTPGNPFTLNVQAGNFGLLGLSNVRTTAFSAGSTFTASLNSSTSSARITAPSGGSLNLGNSSLALALASGYTPQVGHSFTILSAPSGITGKFGNAPEGGTLKIAGSSLYYRVNYTSTAVTVTVVDTPSMFTTKTLVTPISPVAPGGNVNFTATVYDASNNPVRSTGSIGFWYTDDFQSWNLLGGDYIPIDASGKASFTRTLPRTLTVGAVVAFYIDPSKQYRHSWSQDNPDGILFPMVQWYRTNTALTFNSTTNTLRATISSPDGTPTWLGVPFNGWVEFKQNDVTIFVAEVINGVATLNWQAVPRGTRFTARYIPAASFSVLQSTGSLTV